MRYRVSAGCASIHAKAVRQYEGTADTRLLAGYGPPDQNGKATSRTQSTAAPGTTIAACRTCRASGGVNSAVATATTTAIPSHNPVPALYELRNAERRPLRS